MESNETVLAQASAVISFALTEDNPDHRYIVYVGSGDLYKDPPPSEDTDVRSPLGDYMSTMSLVTSSRMNVTRYISLFRQG